MRAHQPSTLSPSAGYLMRTRPIPSGSSFCVTMPTTTDEPNERGGDGLTRSMSVRGERPLIVKCVW